MSENEIDKKVLLYDANLTRFQIEYRLRVMCQDVALRVNKDNTSVNRVVGVLVTAGGCESCRCGHPPSRNSRGFDGRDSAFGSGSKVERIAGEGRIGELGTTNFQRQQQGRGWGDGYSRELRVKVASSNERGRGSNPSETDSRPNAA